MSKYKKIAIIGGGAAGLFSSISSGLHNPKSNIDLFESSSKLLAKLRISGGGRCNVTNNTLEIKELIKNYPRGSKELISPFNQFSVVDTINFFQNENIELKTEPDNRMFPTTDNSETIANCLINKAKELNVKIHFKRKLTKVKYSNNKFKLFFNNEKEFHIYDKLIITTGGTKSSYDLVSEMGHKIIKLVPSLFSFQIKDPLIKDISGISFQDIDLKLKVASKTFKQSGPVLITHWGLSGPATIKLSAFAALELFESDYQARLFLNFIPQINKESLINILSNFKISNQKKKLVSEPLFELPKRFWENLILLNFDKEKTWQEISKKGIQKLITQLTEYQMQVSGKGIFKSEFVTSGGVCLKEINLKTFESKLIPNLFFAGEVLNIDGITGGFNFQAAWTGSWIAGKN